METGSNPMLGVILAFCRMLQSKKRYADIKTTESCHLFGMVDSPDNTLDACETWAFLKEKTQLEDRAGWMALLNKHSMAVAMILEGL